MISKVENVSFVNKAGASLLNLSLTEDAWHIVDDYSADYYGRPHHSKK